MLVLGRKADGAAVSWVKSVLLRRSASAVRKVFGWVWASTASIAAKSCEGVLDLGGLTKLEPAWMVSMVGTVPLSLRCLEAWRNLAAEMLAGLTLGAGLVDWARAASCALKALMLSSGKRGSGSSSPGVTYSSTEIMLCTLEWVCGPDSSAVETSLVERTLRKECRLKLPLVISVLGLGEGECARELEAEPRLR